MLSSPHLAGTKSRISPKMGLKVWAFLLLMALALQSGAYALSILHGLRSEGFSLQASSLEASAQSRVLLCTPEGLKWVALADFSKQNTPPQKSARFLCPFCLLGQSAFTPPTGLNFSPAPLLHTLCWFARSFFSSPQKLKMAWPLSHAPPV